MLEAFNEEKAPEDLIVRKDGVRKLHMRQAYRIIPIYTADRVRRLLRIV